MEKIKTKICSHCKKELDINCFYKKRTSKDGLQYVCKECQKKEMKKRQEKNTKKNKKTFKTLLTIFVNSVTFK